MAAEDPQNVVEPDLKPKIDADETKESGTNGTTKSDDAKPEETSAVNGKDASPKPDADDVKKIAQNKEAFAANGDSSDKTGSEEKEPKAEVDTEMTDANGTDQAEKDSKTSESAESKPVAAPESKSDAEKPSEEKPSEKPSEEKPAGEKTSKATEEADVEGKEGKESKGDAEKDDKERPEPTSTTESTADAMDVDKPDEKADAPAPETATEKASISASNEKSQDGDKETKETKDEKADIPVAETAEKTGSPAAHDKEKPQTEDQEMTEATAHDDSATDTQQSTQQTADISKLEISAEKAKEKEDEPMDDKPISPSTKVPREREEDDVEPPASKRAKTEDTATSATSAPPKEGAAKEDAPTPGAAKPPASSTPADDIPDDQPITPHHVKALRQRLASQKKTKNGAHFRSSVEKLWPVIWDDYKLKVKKPVDLALFEQKLRDEKYHTFGDFKADVQLLYDNAFFYNGPDNFITAAAAFVRDQMFTQLAEIAKSAEPAKSDKNKSQPTRHAEPRAATKERRQSQVQAPPPAAPKLKTDTAEKSKAGPPTPASASSPAFAIPPGGTPQIRRDSTRDDASRPKRPIHPPKRDIDYPPKGSRKRLDPEQRFIDEVLTEIMKPKYSAQNQWFMEPVDPVALNIPTYFSVIKRPMDLQKIVQRNNESHYKSSKEMEKDVRLMVSNSETFNGRDHDVSAAGRELESYLALELKKKDQWMRQHYPPEEKAASNASAASPDASGQGSDDSDGEQGGDDAASEAVQTLSARLAEEQEKLNGMINSKKPDITMIEVQQSIVSTLQRKLVEERTKMANPDKKKSTKKAPRPSGGKPSKPQKSASSGGNGSSHKKPPVNNMASKKASGGSKKAQPKKKPIGSLEKAIIAEGINELDGNTLTKAVDIIKKDTGQNENDEGEMELDIEVLGPEALWKLYDLIHKCHPNIRAKLELQPEYKSQAVAQPEPKAKHTSSSSKPRKNKPMNKEEQERRIAELRELQAQFRRQGSGSQEPPSAQPDPGMAEESSEEESDSEEE